MEKSRVQSVTVEVDFFFFFFFFLIGLINFYDLFHENLGFSNAITIFKFLFLNHSIKLVFFKFGCCWGNNYHSFLQKFIKLLIFKNQKPKPKPTKTNNIDPRNRVRNPPSIPLFWTVSFSLLPRSHPRSFTWSPRSPTSKK